MGVVDFDDVDESNLQRQVIFGTSDAGRPKTEAASRKLADLNPLIDVVTHSHRFTSRNAGALVQDYDVVIDGSDNFATKYLVNDACVLAGKPDVYGSVLRFEGQASVFALGDGPCYRCLFPEPPPPGSVPSCADAGVLGVLPGIVGSIQAAEAIKIILGSGEPLAGRLLLVDALSMSFREIAVPKNPHCPVCSGDPTITELIDYEEFCGAGGVAGASEAPEIGAAELKAKLDAGCDIVLLDVREPYERGICDIGGLLVPMARLPAYAGDLSPESEIVLYCRVGIRSAYAVRYLLEAGFSNVRHLRGGLAAWADEVDPGFPRY